MLWQHVLSLSVFTSYFLAIIGLFSLITYALATSKGKPGALKVATFTGLTIASFAHTWYFMFQYMQWSFAHYLSTHQDLNSEEFIYRLASWLYDTSLFEEAWSYVVFHPLNWWWSEQLCLFTAGAWTVFIAIEGTRRKVRHVWAYMLLGQIVAISVASNLFCLALILSPESTTKNSKNSKAKPRQIHAGPKLWISVLLSLITVAYTPYSTEKTFLPNLLVMHGLLFIPLVSLTDAPSPYSIATRSLYRLIHIASVLIHLRTVVGAVFFLNYATHNAPKQPLIAAWLVLHSNPAQSSIGWDVVWTTISFITWTFMAGKSGPDALGIFSKLYLLCATPVASIGVTAPYVLQPKAKSAPPASAKQD
ncbi:hypothetical protein BDN70DRAFT_884113 [Pholiota conissans]|uniref:Uncharacterized protein n=1 Tax=Pholiota conissans TaxID=109636 RepID=A0A9P5YT61_9AGAR|nr:hypothetical protein BDN70DRAFT_884113 [Pholiota conissans]